jgi:hypothetical protein
MKMKGWELLDTFMFPFQTHGGVCVVGRTYDVLASGCFKKKWKKCSLKIKEIVWT